MSALPLKADKRQIRRHVRFVPKAGERTATNGAFGTSASPLLRGRTLPNPICSMLSFLSGLRWGCPLHRRKIGDGAHPACQPRTAGSEIAKPALARHLDGDGKDQVHHAG